MYVHSNCHTHQEFVLGLTEEARSELPEKIADNNTEIRMRRGLVIPGVVCALVSMLALTPLEGQTETRAAQIENARRLKARRLHTVEESSLKNALHHVRLQNIFGRFNTGADGFRVRFGGLRPSSGFALGPEYRRTFMNDSAVSRTSVRGSFQRTYLADIELQMPHLAADRIFLDLYTVRSDYPRLDYYGPGPESKKSDRTVYRLENTALEGRIGIKPAEHLKIGLNGAYLLYNVGPGSTNDFLSTDQVFAAVPGVTHQTDFLRAGAFVQFDYRDSPQVPHKGGNYVVQYSTYLDRALKQYTFERVDVDLQQYISYSNERRVIALRARSVFTNPHRLQDIPFYVQPTLGGSNDLRGFPAFRFFDNNSTLLSGEYRFLLLTGVQMALFTDAGKVFHQWQQFNLSKLEKDYGFGFRSSTPGFASIRMDFAFSGEGLHVWLAFDNAF